MIALELLDGVVALEFERGGTHWHTDICDEIGVSLYVHGGYEHDAIIWLERWLREHQREGAIIDLGANIGTTAIPFAQRGWDVIAVEPVPSTFALLTENVERNRVGNVRCERVAIARHTGTVTMHTATGSGQAEVTVEGRAPVFTLPATGTVEVPCEPLDVLLARLGVDVVACVWCDVQGSEIDVLATGRELWERGVPLWLEVDPQRIDHRGGLDRFVAQLGPFSRFTPRDADTQPIAAFRSWVEAIAPGDDADTLLH